MTEAQTKGSDVACILVVEDNELVRAVLGQTLTEAGFDVSLAKNADDGMMRLIEPDHISLVIMDVRMPGEKNGIDFAIAARALQETIPIVVLTAYMDKRSTPKSLELRHPFCIITKPYRVKRILATVNEFLADEAA